MIKINASPFLFLLSNFNYLICLLFKSLQLIKPKLKLASKKKQKKLNKKAKKILHKLALHKKVTDGFYKFDVSFKYKPITLVLNSDVTFSVKSLFHFKYL